MGIQKILTYTPDQNTLSNRRERALWDTYRLLGIWGVSNIALRINKTFDPEITEERRKWFIKEVEMGNLPLKNKWVAWCILQLTNIQDEVWCSWMSNERYIKYLNSTSESVLQKIIQTLQINSVEEFEKNILNNPSIMNILRISHNEKWKNGYFFAYYDGENQEQGLMQYPHFHLSSEEKQNEIFTKYFDQTDRKSDDLYIWKKLEVFQSETHIPKIGVCSWAEWSFIESLWWYRILWVYITCEWKVIWHIKYGTENSFLSYVDIWESLKKWGIYSVYKWSFICQRFFSLWVYETDFVWLRYMRASRFTSEELDLLIDVSMKKYRENYRKNP